MTDKTYNVLFLCTGNSARSILAESILKKDGGGRFKAFSAGSQPKGEVNPHALKELQALGYPSTGFSSKSWDVFAEPVAPQLDFIFTVCGSAAGEAFPVWIGHPMTAHWGARIPPPSSDRTPRFSAPSPRPPVSSRTGSWPSSSSRSPRSNEGRSRPGFARSVRWRGRPAPKESRPDVHV